MKTELFTQKVEFVPFSVGLTFESRKEAEILAAIMGYNMTIPGSMLKAEVQEIGGDLMRLIQAEINRGLVSTGTME